MHWVNWFNIKFELKIILRQISKKLQKKQNLIHYFELPSHALIQKHFPGGEGGRAPMDNCVIVFVVGKGGQRLMNANRINTTILHFCRSFDNFSEICQYYFDIARRKYHDVTKRTNLFCINFAITSSNSLFLLKKKKINIFVFIIA